MKHLPWVYLLIFFIGMLILNIHLTNEGFYARSFVPFSDYLLSLITIDPDADYKCRATDISGNRPPTVSSTPPPSTPPPSRPPPPHLPPPPAPAPPKDDADEKTRKIINQLKHEIDQEIRNQKIQSRHEPINVTVTAPPAPSCPSLSIVSDPPDPPVPSSSTAPLPSSSLEQGQECIQSNPVTDCQRKDLSALDMSDYIRKDSIPCWGCSGL